MVLYQKEKEKEKKKEKKKTTKKLFNYNYWFDTKKQHSESEIRATYPPTI